jgi:hypothetical protein
VSMLRALTDAEFEKSKATWHGRFERRVFFSALR